MSGFNIGESCRYSFMFTREFSRPTVTSIHSNNRSQHRSIGCYQMCDATSTSIPIGRQFSMFIVHAACFLRSASYFYLFFFSRLSICAIEFCFVCVCHHNSVTIANEMHRLELTYLHIWDDVCRDEMFICLTIERSGNFLEDEDRWTQRLIRCLTFTIAVDSSRR